MSRVMKLIGIVLLVGLMIAVIIAAAIDRQGSAKRIATASVDHPDHTISTAIPDRCRAITSSDAACEAAWGAERDRFFGRTRR